MSMRVEQAEREDLWKSFRSWLMVILTLILVLLYASALIGWFKPLADEKMIVRLEPLIFIIIGYHFSRLPSQQNEKMLKGEIIRQAQIVDAAQHAKEQAQQDREALEKKVKNARAVLASAAQGLSARALTEKDDGVTIRDETLRYSMSATLNILNS